MSFVLLALGVLAVAIGIWQFALSAQPQMPEQSETLLETPIIEEPVVEAPIIEEPLPEPEPPVVEEEPEPVQQVTLMAVGDNLIHNTIYWSAKNDDETYDFTDMYADIAPVTESYDIACIQQETIFVDEPELYDNYPRFGTPTAVGDALAQAGFDVISAASNHSYDKLDNGILDTINFWRENYPEVKLLGIHDSQDDADTIRIMEKNGIRVGLVNFTYGLNYQLPTNAYMVDTLLDESFVLTTLDRANQLSDFVVVFVHWGIEDEGITDEQRRWAQLFADNGVGAVIGTHPHTLQPMEVLINSHQREMPVFYSLGNFLSHQLLAENMLGGMATLTLERDALGVYAADYNLIPTMNVIIRNHGLFDYRPMLLTDYTEELAAQHRLPGTEVDTMWGIYHEVMKQSK